MNYLKYILIFSIGAVILLNVIWFKSFNLDSKEIVKSILLNSDIDNSSIDIRFFKNKLDDGPYTIIASIMSKDIEVYLKFVEENYKEEICPGFESVHIKNNVYKDRPVNNSDFLLNIKKIRCDYAFYYDIDSSKGIPDWAKSKSLVQLHFDSGICYLILDSAVGFSDYKESGVSLE